jgi:outer membrane lipoprotein-sorting protein
VRAAVAIAVAAALALAGGAVSAKSKSKAKAKELSGDSIVDEMVDKDPLGYGGAEARVLMVLVNNREQQRKRKVMMMSRKDGDTRYTFVRFQSPTDVAGTSFLGIDDDGDRTQHLFLPALQRTRRISSKQRNASFVGTDYSYADMDMRDIDDSSRKRLDDESIGGRDCFVVEVVPSSGDSEYARVTLWVEKKSMLPLRMRFYDSSDNEVKRFTAKEIKKVDGRWIINESKMVDLKREHSTIMKVVEITLRDDIPLEQFTVRALERG